MLVMILRTDRRTVRLLFNQYHGEILTLVSSPSCLLSSGGESAVHLDWGKREEGGSCPLSEPSEASAASDPAITSKLSRKVQEHGNFFIE